MVPLRLVGEVRHQDEWLPGQFEPLIDQGTFLIVQQRLGGKVFHTHQMTFAGSLITCGHCGHLITGEKKAKQSKSGQKTYNYYRCTRYNQRGHPRDRVTEGELEDQLLAMWDRLRVEDDDVREWIV